MRNMFFNYNELYKQLNKKVDLDKIERQIERLDAQYCDEIVTWCLYNGCYAQKCEPEASPTLLNRLQYCVYITGLAGIDYDLILNVSSEHYAMVKNGIVGDMLFDWPDSDWLNIPDIQRHISISKRRFK